QRQEGAGQQQDDERPQRDLAEQERPVVGEDLAHEHAQAACPTEPVIQPPARAGQAPGNASVLTHCSPPAPANLRWPRRRRASQRTKARHGLDPRRSRPGRRSGTATGPPSKAAIIIITAASCLIAATFPPRLAGPAAAWRHNGALSRRRILKHYFKDNLCMMQKKGWGGRERTPGGLVHWRAGAAYRRARRDVAQLGRQAR